MDPAADGLLHLLKAEPTLLPEAPADHLGAAITHRTQDEIHHCLRCGQDAGIAYIAHTDAGNRWIDLCPQCAYWLRCNATPG